jgi:hypothetical protein
MLTTSGIYVRGVIHREPCGCTYRQVDVPDDMAIGQGWQQVAWCAEHKCPRPCPNPDHFHGHTSPAT